MQINFSIKKIYLSNSDKINTKIIAKKLKNREYKQ
jgi:hypothetical protein